MTKLLALPMTVGVDRRVSKVTSANIGLVDLRNLPSVEADLKNISGDLPAEKVADIFHANCNQIRHCYEQLLQRSPTNAGTLDPSFIVNHVGQVESAKIDSGSLKDKVMRDCVVKRVKRWVFRLSETKHAKVKVYAVKFHQPIH